MNASWYDILDVDPQATGDEIRAAWRSAVADLDPTDRRFRVYNQAAEVLLDPEKRAAYDAQIAAADDTTPDPDETPDADGRPDPAVRRADPHVGRPDPLVGRADPLVGRAESRPPVDDERRTRSLPVVPGWLLIGVAVLTAAALVFAGVELTRSSPASSEADATAAQAAAERAIVPILSYDAHHLGQSAAAATPLMTSGEQAQYDKLFAVIRQNAPRTGTVVKASYVASGIVRTGSGRVDVLVFVNQATTNKQHPKTPVVYKNQATVSMEKVGNDWLVDNIVTGAATR